ncbi:sulfate transporter CysZ [Amphritea balenae]|uniref:Sulfate transporter CysZ n=1 Tax=Amphritea balenae TaxID=452629 RepID=A0A3P1SRK1_9GAMM|nr:sulfate transporter CysZ [Amphritea balenae]RRC98802.1 sulfate transporter CysZ [Amphritea balenae]GGK61841.1 sulfate transporter CysZ [Amphritea balenae]
MKGNPLRGAGFFLRGLSMLPEKGIRHFVLVPLLINMFLFSGAIWLLFDQMGVWIDYLLSSILPDWDWLQFLRYILWPMVAILVVIAVYYSFSVVANIIAAPFNGILSEKVEQRLRGVTITDSGWKEILALIPRTVAREVSKLLYYLPRLLFLMVLAFIPVLGWIAPFLLFLFGCWMMAIQYCDYPMDNNKVSFKDMKQSLKERRMTSVGFGGLVSIGMMIPLVNLLVMPAAVVGATIFWVEEYANDQGEIVINPAIDSSESPDRLESK